MQQDKREMFYAILLVVILSPLPFGSTYQWSWASISAIVGFLLALWALRCLLRPHSLAFGLGRLWFSALLYGLVLGWVMLQASNLTPQGWHHSVWQQSADVLDLQLTGSISINPDATWAGVLQMLTYAGVFWLAAQCCRSRVRARHALWALAIAGSLYAIYGLLTWLSGSGLVLWFDFPGGSSVRSTFTNRNMYAFYAAMGMLCTSALLCERVLEALEQASGNEEPLIGQIESASYKTLALFALALVQISAISFTVSRGGIIAAAVSMGVLIACMMKGRRLSLVAQRTGLVLMIGTSVLAFAVLGMSLGTRGVEFLLDSGGRLDGYRITLDAIKEAPIQGYGLGSFQDIFHLYDDGSVLPTLDYSHNLYLGTTVELGLPATLALLLAISGIVVTCIQGLSRRRRDHLYPALGVAATALVAIHGAVDSPLSLPANAITYSFILGLSFAQSWSSESVSTTGSAGRKPSQTVQQHPV